MHSWAGGAAGEEGEGLPQWPVAAHEEEGLAWPGLASVVGGCS